MKIIFFCLLYIFFTANSTASYRIIFDDYEQARTPVEKAFPFEMPTAKENVFEFKADDIEASRVLENLNQAPADENHINKYMATINSEEKLKHLFNAAVYLLKSPISYQNEGVETIHTGIHYVDSRCLYLLSFAYLTKPDISPWLRYYYAMALLYFPKKASKLFKQKNPIEFAFKIYDQWLQTILDDYYAETEQIKEDVSIPLVTFAIHDEQKKYDKAHLEFYALLSLKASNALLEKEPQNDKAKLFVKALVKYDPTAKTDEKGRKKDGQASWLEGPAYIALGAAAIPALILAHRVSQTLYHK